MMNQNYLSKCLGDQYGKNPYTSQGLLRSMAHICVINLNKITYVMLYDDIVFRNNYLK